MNDAPALFQPQGAGSAADRRMRILGQPQLEHYIEFVREKVVGGATANVRALADEWREANDHYYELETSEAGLAETIRLRDPDASIAPLIERLEADPSYVDAFGALPSRIVMVELDKLMVSQQSIALGHLETKMARLGPSPDPESLFRFCQPVERGETPPVTVRKIDERRYFFSCESSDFRGHDASLLRPDQILGGLSTHDPLSAVVALPVGFGCNHFHAIEADGRLLLQNGYHRAYALRALGIRFAPCVVQTVTRRDELNLVADEDVARSPEFYFRAKRPPLLKDFFDPNIVKQFDVRRTRRLIEVRFEIREHQVVD